MKTVIAPTINAATHEFFVPTDQFVSIAQNGLSGAELVGIDADMDGTWVQVLPVVILDTSVNLIQLGGPCTYRINKPITTNPTGLYLES